MSLDVHNYIKDIERFGFEKVLELPFEDLDHNKNCFYVYFHSKYGILLEFDTYFGNRLNGGYYFYQWKPYNQKNPHCNALSSGGFIKREDRDGEYIWAGHGDCRSGMQYSIKLLVENGEFITPWIKSDGIFSPSLIHYADHETPISASWDEGYELYKRALVEKTPDRFKMLPVYVQSAIENGMRFKVRD